MSALSFAPWISFESTVPAAAGAEEADIDVPGNHLSAMRDKELLLRGDVPDEDGWCSCRVGFGDGYFTAILGAMVAAGAVLAMFLGLERRVPALAVVGGLTALALTGYNAMADWSALVYTDVAFLEEADGHRTFWLYMLLAAEAMAAVLGAALWSILREDDADTDYDDNDDEDTGFDENAPRAEGLEGWALPGRRSRWQQPLQWGS